MIQRKEKEGNNMSIPPITDPLGKHWQQPEIKEIEIDSTHALMSKKAFNELLEYSCSQPTKVYEGKMWKSKLGNKWILHWFGKSDHPDFCSNNNRRILIA